MSGTSTGARLATVAPALLLVVVMVGALGAIPLDAASASPALVSVAPPLQVGGPPGPPGPPGGPPPSFGGPNIPPFVLQILRAVLPLPILRLLESFGILQPASP